MVRFTDQWALRDGGREVDRWQVDEKEVVGGLLVPLLSRQPPKRVEWPRGVVLHALTRGPLEDMPWSFDFSARPLVSARLKALFERVAPGKIQYLPVRVRYRKEPIMRARYWVANFLDEVDGLDEERATWLNMPSGRDLFIPAIRKDVDGRQHPICMIRWNSNVHWYMRRDIAEEIVRRDMSGVCFCEDKPYWTAEDEARDEAALKKRARLDKANESRKLRK